jgi:uncharacterized protein (TIGR03435 family)
MTDLSDMDLARKYATGNSEPAFAELVRRHLNLVYSVALRFADNPQDAQDITQAVFIILAQKAVRLRQRTVLTGWLYETTRFTALRFLRTKNRRQFREQEAYMQSTLDESNPDGVWLRLAPLLEDGMARLNEKERALLALRFYENRTGAEAAAQLGIEEWAARKRMERALEKLRKFFGQRGAVFSATAIAGAISANSVHAAPLGLAKTVSALALTKGATAGGSTLALVKGAMKLMAWSKMQTAFVVGVGILLAAGTAATFTVKEIQEYGKYPWEVPHVDSTTFYAASAQVIIVPTKFTAFGGSMADNTRGVIGIAQPLGKIIEAAYEQNKVHTVFETTLPDGKYDYIAKLVGARQAHQYLAINTNWTIQLQSLIRQKFGIVGNLERRATNVLVMKPVNAAPIGFKVSHTMPGGFAIKETLEEGTSFHKQPIATLTSLLEAYLQMPVIDQTGLTNEYDFALRWDRADPRQTDNEGLKQALLDQLGLELVPTNMPIEMLIVEKANN